MEIWRLLSHVADPTEEVERGIGGQAGMKGEKWRAWMATQSSSRLLLLLLLLLHFPEHVCVLMIADTIYYSALQPTSAKYHRYEYENSGLHSGSITSREKTKARQEWARDI